jgi:shikimate dehydrogenase
MTRPYAEVIGDPVAHSKSPVIHGFWLAKLGIEAEYRKTHVRAEALADYFARRREDAKWLGCNVTVPHKIAAAALMERLDSGAMRIGAVNCVTANGIGYNSDIEGVAAPLRAARFVGGTAVVIGTGGAARAAVAALDMFSVSRLIVMARDADKAALLLGQRPGAVMSMSESLPSCDLLFNATSLGMTGQPRLDVDTSALSSCAIVFDAVYAPLETPLLAAAQARALQTIDGLQMLVAQAATAFELFFGQPAPRQHDTELRALLTA